MVAISPRASQRRLLRVPEDTPPRVPVDLSARRSPRPRLDDTLAEFAHDLCTPVTAIGTTVELLLARFESLDKDEAVHLLRRLRHGARWLEELLGDVTEGRLNPAADGYEFSGGVFSLGQCLAGVVPLMQPLLDRRGQQVALGLPSRPVMVWGDEHLLRRVLVNLLNNAVKYSAAHDLIHLTLTVDASWARVEVRDHGPGLGQLPPERAFQPRVRGPAAAAAGLPDGSGLGLSIVKSIVELHGGNVGARTAAGGGAAFWFTLPRLGTRRSSLLAARLPRPGAHRPQR
jgi:signal transduction histidine kinase